VTPRRQPCDDGEMQPRVCRSTLLLIAAALACGPKTNDTLFEDTATSQPLTTTGPGPTNTADPSMPPQVTDSGTTEIDEPDTLGPSGPSSVSVSVTVVSESESISITDSTSTTGVETLTDPDPSGDNSDLCNHAGGLAGVEELTSLFLAEVVADDRINAYFLRSDLDVGGLAKCVVDQLGEAFGCAGVVYGCKTMKASHEGLGISIHDFNDFAQDFSVAWDAHKQANAPDLTDDEKSTVLGVLGSLSPDIVEDSDNDLTVYQRLGRKPAIRGLVGQPDAPLSFVANVAKDSAINGFFGGADFDRLNTCLTRQISSIDGPNNYGLEVDPPAADIDPGVSLANPCRDMAPSHADLVDANDMQGVEFSDFVSLVSDLVTAMTDAGVPMNDQNLIAGALGPLCSSIVTVDPENCP
jgi:truncated hemoglobin YjbI